MFGKGINRQTCEFYVRQPLKLTPRQPIQKFPFCEKQKEGQSSASKYSRNCIKKVKTNFQIATQAPGLHKKQIRTTLKV